MGTRLLYPRSICCIPEARRVDVTLVTSQVSKLLDRVGLWEEYAVNFFQRNRGSEYAVEFLVFECPFTAKRKQSCWPNRWDTLPSNAIQPGAVP